MVIVERDGEESMLLQGGAQQRSLDRLGRQNTDGVYQGPRRRQMEKPPQESRFEEMWQEL